jgi:hypothetical protein
MDLDLCGLLNVCKLSERALYALSPVELDVSVPIIASDKFRGSGHDEMADCGRNAQQKS